MEILKVQKPIEMYNIYRAVLMAKLGLVCQFASRTVQPRPVDKFHLSTLIKSNIFNLEFASALMPVSSLESRSAQSNPETIWLN